MDTLQARQPEMQTIFIGYDAREHEAAAVAAFSIRRRTTARTKIYLLDHVLLRRLRLFNRPWFINEEGQYRDTGDGQPFSTAFSHSRFLAFHLARELGCTGPCMFVDCDWLFLSDVSELLSAQKQEPSKIGVVMRDRKVAENTFKMDGMIQQNYSRKLWSALFTFMPTSILAKVFTPDVVNHSSGGVLHGFMHRDDNQFWSIEPDWHYIPSLDGPSVRSLTPTSRGIHFSEFSPWLNPEKGVDSYGTFELWYQERAALLELAGTTGKLMWIDDLALDLLAAKS